MAGRFLQAQDELKAELASIRPKSTADEAVDRILAQSSGESQLKGSRSRLIRLKDRPPRHRRWTIAISTTLAAVTCVIGLWVVNQVNVPDSLVDQTPSFSTRTADLRLMTDQNAIIFETSKPDIKVVWLY